MAELMHFEKTKGTKHGWYFMYSGDEAENEK